MGLSTLVDIIEKQCKVELIPDFVEGRCFLVLGDTEIHNNEYIYWKSFSCMKTNSKQATTTPDGYLRLS